MVFNSRCVAKVCWSHENASTAEVMPPRMALSQVQYVVKRQVSHGAVTALHQGEPCGIGMATGGRQCATAPFFVTSLVSGSQVWGKQGNVQQPSRSDLCKLPLAYIMQDYPPGCTSTEALPASASR